jgi:hypothetical protein
MKTIAQNAALTLVSAGLMFLAANVFFAFAFHQGTFPRNLVWKSGSFQYTYYPDTFAWSGGGDYVAITGDSYAEGAGDAFLGDEDAFSIAHFLHRGDGRNHLIFGRSGYGSVSAAKSVAENIRYSHLSPYVRDLEAPAEILFCFYEGNDLNNNHDFLAFHGLEGAAGQSGDALAGLDRAILAHRPDGDAGWKVALRAYVPLLDLLSASYDDALAMIGGQAQAVPSADERVNVLSHRLGRVALPPLQAAPVELAEDELERAILVFRRSVAYLQAQFPKAAIKVVYLPSAVSLYDWDGEIRIQKYTESPKRQTTAAENRALSDRLRARLRRISTEDGWALIDVTDRLRADAAEAYLHGPVDWKHFNGRGYRLIAEAILGN